MAPRILLLLCTSVLLAGEPGVSAHLVGGTVPALQGAVHGRIQFAAEETLLYHSRQTRLSIPYARIHTLEYGQRVHRRYVEAILISPVLLLSKSRKHFLTLGYTDEAGRRQVLVFELHKRDVRAVLAALEAKTGRKVEYQDEEARNSGTR